MTSQVDYKSDASEVTTKCTTPFTLAKRKATSPVSSHGLPYKTRNRNQRRPVQNQSRLLQTEPSLVSKNQPSKGLNRDGERPLATIATLGSNEKHLQEEDEESSSDDNVSIDNKDASEPDLPKNHSQVSSNDFQSSGRKHRPLTSAIHSQMLIISYQGAQYYRCNHCAKQYKKSGGTHAPTRHLKDSH